MTQDFFELIISKLKDPTEKVAMPSGNIVFNNDKYEITCYDDRIIIRNSETRDTIYYYIKGVINKWRYHCAWNNRINQESIKCLNDYQKVAQ